MGSGFVPGGIYGAALGGFAAVLAETAAYAAFVGGAVAAAGAAGMYFFTIDEGEAQALPARLVRWDWSDTFHRRALGAGCSFRPDGQVVLWVMAQTPAEYARDTAGARNWILDQAQAMVQEMEALFDRDGRVGCGGHKLAERPFRTAERDNDDWVGVAFVFDLA